MLEIYSLRGLVKLYAPPPPCPGFEKWNIPEYSKNPEYSIFCRFLYVPDFFWNIPIYLISQIFGHLYVPFLKWNIPIFHDIPKKREWVCPKYFLEYSRIPNQQQISMSHIYIGISWNIPGIFLEYSNLVVNHKK